MGGGVSGGVSAARDRRAEIEAGLARVRSRIEQACAAAGRHADEVGLVVVTKFFPVSDVRLLADLGVTDVGENRHQEAEAKAAELAGLGLRWHFIGALQSNKAAAVAAYADMVESVDRPKIVTALSRGAVRSGREVDCLVQVSLDPPGASGRAGANPADVLELAGLVADGEGLRLRGLMAVAPPDGDPDEAFARLARIADDVRSGHPEADRLSAGMSGDLEAAVRAGATHVRVGSAILGKRPGIQ